MASSDRTQDLILEVHKACKSVIPHAAMLIYLLNIIVSYQIPVSLVKPIAKPISETSYVCNWLFLFVDFHLLSVCWYRVTMHLISVQDFDEDEILTRFSNHIWKGYRQPFLATLRHLIRYCTWKHLITKTQCSCCLGFSKKQNNNNNNLYYLNSVVFVFLYNNSL